MPGTRAARRNIIAQNLRRTLMRKICAPKFGAKIAPRIPAEICAQKLRKHTENANMHTVHTQFLKSLTSSNASSSTTPLPLRPRARPRALGFSCGPSFCAAAGSYSTQTLVNCVRTYAYIVTCKHTCICTKQGYIDSIFVINA